MLADVYFDFHTPELYLVYESENWSKWYSKLVQLELSNKESYFAERVSSLANLIRPSNLDVWELLKEEYDGPIINRSIISKIVDEWIKLYKECEGEQTSSPYEPCDMWSPEQIRILLKKHKGHHLVIRVEENLIAKE